MYMTRENSDEKTSIGVKAFKNEAKLLTLNWIDHSTSHGLPNIFRTHNWFIRIMWSVTFMGSLAYCWFLIYNSVQEFLKNKTTVTTEYVRQTPSPFPAVTICNVNAFNEQKAINYILNATGKVFDFDCTRNQTNINVETLILCLNQNEDITAYPDFKIILNKIKRSVINSNLTNNELESLGFSLKSDMLLKCVYNGMICDSTWFTNFWHTEYGMCYTFNSGKNNSILKTSTTDPVNGLSLELTVDPMNGTIFGYRSGLYVLVHNQTKLPTSMSGAIFVPTQSETYIGVLRTFTSKEASPYSNCIKDLTPFSEYSRKIFGYFADMNVTYYDQRLCLDLCYQDVVTKNCSCCSSVTSCMGGKMFCSSFDELDCETSIKTKLSMGDTNEICKNVCQEPCVSQSFDLSISSTSFPSDSYYIILSKIIFADRFFWKNSLVRLIVNYDDLSYTQITESPKVTVESLMGNVGGQLGLFIGISLLSLLEVVEIVIEITVLAYKKFIKHKVNP